jgi:hypothetical protein
MAVAGNYDLGHVEAKRGNAKAGPTNVRLICAHVLSKQRIGNTWGRAIERPLSGQQETDLPQSLENSFVRGRLDLRYVEVKLEYPIIPVPRSDVSNDRFGFVPGESRGFCRE